MSFGDENVTNNRVSSPAKHTIPKVGKEPMEKLARNTGPIKAEAGGLAWTAASSSKSPSNAAPKIPSRIMKRLQQNIVNKGKLLAEKQQAHLHVAPRQKHHKATTTDRQRKVEKVKGAKPTRTSGGKRSKRRKKEHDADTRRKKGPGLFVPHQNTRRKGKGKKRHEHEHDHHHDHHQPVQKDPRRPEHNDRAKHTSSITLSQTPSAPAPARHTLPGAAAENASTVKKKEPTTDNLRMAEGLLQEHNRGSLAAVAGSAIINHTFQQAAGVHDEDATCPTRQTTPSKRANRTASSATTTRQDDRETGAVDGQGSKDQRVHHIHHHHHFVADGELKKFLAGMSGVYAKSVQPVESAVAHTVASSPASTALSDEATLEDEVGNSGREQPSSSAMMTPSLSAFDKLKSKVAQRAAQKKRSVAGRSGAPVWSSPQSSHEEEEEFVAEEWTTPPKLTAREVARFQEATGIVFPMPDDTQERASSLGQQQESENRTTVVQTGVGADRKPTNGFGWRLVEPRFHLNASQSAFEGPSHLDVSAELPEFDFVKQLFLQSDVSSSSTPKNILRIDHRPSRQFAEAQSLDHDGRLRPLGVFFFFGQQWQDLALIAERGMVGFVKARASEPWDTMYCFGSNLSAAKHALLQANGDGAETSPHFSRVLVVGIPVAFQEQIRELEVSDLEGGGVLDKVSATLSASSREAKAVAVRALNTQEACLFASQQFLSSILPLYLVELDHD